jgi:hypothetical protein
MSAEWFDPTRDPLDELAAVPVWPKPLARSAVPDALRGNPLVEELLAMTPEQERGLAALAESDARDDASVAEAILASVR